MVDADQSPGRAAVEIEGGVSGDALQLPAQGHELQDGFFVVQSRGFQKGACGVLGSLECRFNDLLSGGEFHSLPGSNEVGPASQPVNSYGGLDGRQRLDDATRRAQPDGYQLVRRLRAREWP